MKTNYCVLTQLMAICGAGKDDECECEYAASGYDSDCIYRVHGHCCHAIAIRTSTRMDGQSEDALKHLFNGV